MRLELAMLTKWSTIKNSCADLSSRIYDSVSYYPPRNINCMNSKTIQREWWCPACLSPIQMTIFIVFSSLLLIFIILHFFFFASTVRSNGQEAGRVGIHERGTHRWKSQIVCLVWSDASLWFCLYNFILVIACMWWLYKAWLIHSNQVIQMRKPQHNRMNE